MLTCLLHVVAYGSGRTESDDTSGLFGPGEHSLTVRLEITGNLKDNHK